MRPGCGWPAYTTRRTPEQVERPSTPRTDPGYATGRRSSDGGLRGGVGGGGTVADRLIAPPTAASSPSPSPVCSDSACKATASANGSDSSSANCRARTAISSAAGRPHPTAPPPAGRPTRGWAARGHGPPWLRPARCRWLRSANRWRPGSTPSPTPAPVCMNRKSGSHTPCGPRPASPRQPRPRRAWRAPRPDAKVQAGRKPVVTPWFSTPASASCSILTAVTQFTAHQFGTAHHEHQVGVRQAGHVLGERRQHGPRRGDIRRCSPLSRQARAYTPPNQNRMCGRLVGVGGPVDRGPSRRRRSSVWPSAPTRHHQRHRGQHRVEVGQRARIPVPPAPSPRRSTQRAKTASTQASTRSAPRARLRSRRRCASAARMGDSFGGPAQHPDQVRRPQGDPRGVGAIGLAELLQKFLGLGSGPGQEPVRPPATSTARGEPASAAALPKTLGEVEVQQPSSRAGQRPGYRSGSGGRSDSERQQRAPHRGLRIAIGGLLRADPLRQFTAHLRQVHLTGGRTAQFAEQWVRQAGEQLTARCVRR